MKSNAIGSFCQLETLCLYREVSNCRKVLESEADQLVTDAVEPSEISILVHIESGAAEGED